MTKKKFLSTAFLQFFTQFSSLNKTNFHIFYFFFPDIPQTVNLEGVIRQPDWQNKALRCTTKTALKSVLAAQKAAERQDRSKKLFESGRRKYNKKFAQGLVANSKKTLFKKK